MFDSGAVAFLFQKLVYNEQLLPKGVVPRGRRHEVSGAEVSPKSTSKSFQKGLTTRSRLYYQNELASRNEV